ncbi:MAG: hypothetical protein KDJ48_09545 [Nitratireductor sp.]|nr:hypothetical protein [Nitratireductor sp.]
MTSMTANEAARQTAIRLGRDPHQQFNRRLNGVRTSVAMPAPEPHKPVISGSTSGFIFRLSAVLIAISVLVFAIAHMVGNELSRAGHSIDTSIREIVIGRDVVRIPGNLIRFGSQRRASESQRVDLYMHWPDMAGYSEELSSVFNRETVDPSIIFATLEPRTMTRDMSGRIEPIYSKFMIGPERDVGHGLKERALDASGGFMDEVLVYEAGSPYPFAARCISDTAQSATHFCLRDIQVGRDLMATYRFHESLLGNWRAMDAAIRERLKQIVVE